MKRFQAFVFVAIVVILIPFGGTLAAETETLTGGFVWNNDNKKGDLEAVFTRTEEGKYDVAFSFVWEGEPHTWEGTAEGSLIKGALSGEVQTDNPERKNTFQFAGKFKKGRFKGTHSTTRDGEKKEMGTLTLKR